MRETQQKILEMTLEEFKEWNVPEGWKMIMLSGEDTLIWSEQPGRSCFKIRVTIQK